MHNNGIKYEHRIIFTISARIKGILLSYIVNVKSILIVK